MGVWSQNGIKPPTTRNAFLFMKRASIVICTHSTTMFGRIRNILYCSPFIFECNVAPCNVAPLPCGSCRPRACSRGEQARMCMPVGLTAHDAGGLRHHFSGCVCVFPPSTDAAGFCDSFAELGSVHASSRLGTRLSRCAARLDSWGS